MVQAHIQQSLWSLASEELISRFFIPVVLAPGSNPSSGFETARARAGYCMGTASAAAPAPAAPRPRAHTDPLKARGVDPVHACECLG